MPSRQPMPGIILCGGPLPKQYITPGNGLYVRVGYEYMIKGEILQGNGRIEVTYSGSAKEVMKRINASGHPARQFLNDPKTEIYVRKLYGIKDATLSLRDTKRALSSMEQGTQEEMKTLGEEEGWKSANKIPAARSENAQAWRQRYDMRPGEWVELTRQGGRFTSGGLAWLQAFSLIVGVLAEAQAGGRWVHQNAPYFFEDDQGIFTLQQATVLFVFHRTPLKHYLSGPSQGTNVYINDQEYSNLKDEAEALWGKINDGESPDKFVPGLLRPDPPVETETLPDRA